MHSLLYYIVEESGLHKTAILFFIYRTDRTFINLIKITQRDQTIALFESLPES